MQSQDHPNPKPKENLGKECCGGRKKLIILIFWPNFHFLPYSFPTSVQIGTYFYIIVSTAHIPFYIFVLNHFFMLPQAFK